MRWISGLLTAVLAVLVLGAVVAMGSGRAGAVDPPPPVCDGIVGERLCVDPPDATNTVGETHVLTATVDYEPYLGADTIKFYVNSDPSAVPAPPPTYTCTLVADAATPALDGSCTYSYTSLTTGTDTIVAIRPRSADGEQPELRVTVYKTWEAAGPQTAPDVEITCGAALPPVAAGTPVTVSGTLTDPDGGPWSAVVTWGGESADAPVSVTPGAVSFTHTYATPGVYPSAVSVTVTDATGGLSDTDATGACPDYIIVYDPSAGFVTGGGWITSPAGAYAVDLTLSGKATFGFVSKYKKGATVPIGQTEFQFHAGGFNFHSEAYQWLVVSGCKAQYKGTGSVNGVTGYGFMLTATDGNICSVKGPDKFRIKVWALEGGAVVYDNVVGGADDADPQLLSQGSIVIHK